MILNLDTQLKVYCVILLIFSAGILMVFPFDAAGIFRKGRRLVPIRELIAQEAIRDRLNESGWRKWLTGLALVRKLNSSRVETTISEDLAILHNLILAHHGNISSDAVISLLAERKNPLTKTYLNMLSYLRMGKTDEAIKEMGDAVNTDLGMEYASLLVNWEQIKPEQLKEVILSYRRNIREINATKQKRMDETISDILYFPATANVFLIFLNFVYVAYFMEQKELLSILM